MWAGSGGSAPTPAGKEYHALPIFGSMNLEGILMETVILVSLVSAISAGFACVYAHSRAEKHAWGFLRRYGTGVITWLVALMPVFVSAVTTGITPLPVAGLLYGMIVLVIAAMGIATLACYEPPITLPEEDPLEVKINNALRPK
jgi:hypothetical protein